MIRGIDWVDGEGVMPQDIEAAEQRCGFRVEEGDVLMVRTGQLKHRNQQARSIHWRRDQQLARPPACLFHQRGIA